VKVLVTGGTGFLGRHVARHFVEAGHDVTVFDLAEPHDPETRWVSGNLVDPDACRRATYGVDAVVHLGAVGDVYLAGEDPVLAARVNVVGTATVAEAARTQGVPKFVYASTWEVYGHPEYQPLDEKHRCEPDHPYNITKLAGEQLVRSYAALKGLPAVCLRLGTAFGTGMRPNSVFSIFVERAAAGQPLRIQGGGAQIRQFTHARDIARGFELAAGSALENHFMNLVAAETTTIRQLAEAVVERLPTELEIAEARAGEVPSALVSSALALDLLGWEAERTLAQGLDEIIAERVRR